MPAVVGLRTNWRIGQGVEELVGDDEERVVADGVDLGRPVGMVLAEPRLLLGAEVGVGLEELEVERVEEAVGACAATRSTSCHQRAAAGAELEQREARRLAHLLPEVDDEEADELAEHLADLGGGDEVAGRAERVAAARSSRGAGG